MSETEKPAKKAPAKKTRARKPAKRAAKMGAPTKYHPSMLQKLVDGGMQGMGMAELARELGISKPTLLNWSNPKHANYRQDFFDALTRARGLSEAWWEAQGRWNLHSRDFRDGLWKTNMVNRFPDDWADRNKMDIDAKVEVKELPSDRDLARAVLTLLGGGLKNGNK